MRVRALIILGVMLLGAKVAHATSTGPIPPAYHNVAEQHRIPAAVFYTLALMESGQSIKTGQFRPWPWTLTINGEPHYFDTYEGALTKLKSTLAEGEPRQLGVGLFQIEYRYHKDQFASLEDMLWPYKNTKVAAIIFTDLLQQTQNNLWEAIGRFHSRTDKFAQRYQMRFGERLVALIAEEEAS